MINLETYILIILHYNIFLELFPFFDLSASIIIKHKLLSCLPLFKTFGLFWVFNHYATQNNSHSSFFVIYSIGTLLWALVEPQYYLMLTDLMRLISEIQEVTCLDGMYEERHN